MWRLAWLVCLGLLWSGSAEATNNIYSETSHTIFGSVVGGVCTWGADFYLPEHRALLGFGVAAGLGVLEQLHSKGGFSALDTGANALGAAIGAVLTDRFLLAPVIRREAGSAYLGVMVGGRF